MRFQCPGGCCVLLPSSHVSTIASWAAVRVSEICLTSARPSRNAVEPKAGGGPARNCVTSIPSQVRTLPKQGSTGCGLGGTASSCQNWLAGVGGVAGQFAAAAPSVAARASTACATAAPIESPVASVPAASLSSAAAITAALAASGYKPASTFADA